MKTLYVLFFLLLSIPVMSQQRISGLVTDLTGNPLEMVTIMLYQHGKQVDQQLSVQGKFTLAHLNNDPYQFTATLIGYGKLSGAFTLPKDTLWLKMSESRTELKAVEVLSHTPQVEHKADRTIFNVQNSILASGSNVWDALRKAPGVQTGDQGQVTANSKGATIYVNDKPVQLSGEDLVNYLSSLPSDQVAKIEVISNPSARYDAKGGSVINIVTKKPKANGLNGTVNAGYTQASYGSYNASTTFNYRQDKLNIYGNYGYSDKKIRRPIEAYTIFETPNSYAYWENTRTVVPEIRAHSYQLGADYDLGAGQMIGVLVNGYNADRSSPYDITNPVFNDHRSQADSTLNTHSELGGTTSQYSFNVNYKLKLDSAGKSLNVDFDYVPYRNSAGTYVSTNTVLPDGASYKSFDIYTPSFQNIDIWSGKMDYTYALGNSWNLESGVKYTGIHTDNQFDYYEMGSGKPVYDISRSNHFKYSENTAAAYTSASTHIGKWNLEAGLRAEYTRTRGNSITLDSVNNNNYLKLFPTVSLSYKPSDDHQFALNFNRRIDRPEYKQLNPARAYSSPYSFQQGNPALQPYITTNAEVNYTLKERYTVSASYSGMQGLFSNVNIQDNVQHTSYDTQLNLGYIHDFFLTFLVNVSPAPWWEVNLTLSGFYRQQGTDFLTSYYTSHNWATELSATQSFVLSKKGGLKAELQTYYRSPINQGILYVASNNDVSIGFSKTVMHNKGSVKINCNDLLNGNPYRLTNNYLDQHNGMRVGNDTRSVSVSFSYRFGKKIEASRKRSTATEDEKRRAN